MTSTFSQSRDDIATVFWDKWLAETPALNGGNVVPVLWQWVDASGQSPDPSGPFARLTIRHVPGGRHTFGEAGNRRHERLGSVFVQVFTPLGLKTGAALMENLATIARDAFENQRTPSGVWFRNASIREAEPFQGWNQANVSAEFVYDEAK